MKLKEERPLLSKRDDESDIGRIIISKRGRDKNLLFIILNVCGEYAYIVNGKARCINKPKKKKFKHFQKTNYFFEISIKTLDAHIIKALRAFENLKNKNSGNS